MKRYSLSAVQLLLCAWLAGTLAEDKEELLIGWKGETYVAHQQQKTKKGRYGDNPWVETISWSPRAFVYHNFLTPGECDHLVAIGKQRVSRSMVVDSKTGQSKLDDIRTSFGAAFGRGEDAVIAGVEEKIAEWTHLPPENGEPIQVLRYIDNQKYDHHWDWFDDPVHHEAYLRDGNRYATVLLYLAEVEEGGETNLPLAEPLDAAAQRLDNPSKCAAAGGLSVRPHKGDALLFFDMDIEGKVGERAALHASCPTIKGMKWTATKWIHSKPYMGSYDPLGKAGQCKDIGIGCSALAAAGKCDSDAATLVGSSGTCRRTCGDCVDCPKGDIICLRKNVRGLRSIEAAAAARGSGAAP